MKILYVGNFEPQHATEVHLAATLEDYGHELKRVQENHIQTGTLRRDVEDFNPDMFMWTRTWPGYVSDADLTWLRALAIPSISYHLDLYVPLKRQEQPPIEDDPFWRTDHVFTPDGDPKSEARFKELGINHHYLKPGVFKPECVEGTKRQEYAYDIAFIGKTANYHPEWPYREKLIDWLRENYGGWFKIYGHPYKTVRNEELNDVLASTKIIIGDTLCPHFTHERYWSDRVYETTGRGGFIIHPRIKGLEEEFKDGEEIAFYNYGDFDHLKQLIDFYREHDDYREAVRKKGMARTKAEHTYHNRIEEMFNILGMPVKQKRVLTSVA